MKTLHCLLLLLAALSLAGCSKPVATTEAEPSAPETTAPVAPEAPPATPAPLAAATPPAAKPAPELAPEGIFYLVAAVRVETSDGIVGLKPGTGVKLVRPGIYLTPAGEQPLRDDQMTNNLALARAARDGHASAQAAVQMQIATIGVQARASDSAAAVAAQDNHAAAVAGLERQKIEARLTGLKQQEATLQTQISTLSARNSKESYNEAMKGRTVTSTTDSQLAAARAQLKNVRAQITETNRELRTK